MNRVRNTAYSERTVATDFSGCQSAHSKLLKAMPWGMRAQQCEGLSMQWFQRLQTAAHAYASQRTVYVTYVNIRRYVVVKENDLPSEAVESLCCFGPIFQAVIENRLQ